jgi:arylsulfatase A-like enzyme
MPKRLHPALACGLALAVYGLACRGPGAPSAEAAPPSPAPSAGRPAPVALDEGGPTLDLLTSRALWHLHRTGLVIPFGSEGFHKYSQEYANPWRGLAKLDEREGRTLGATAATLRFPWDMDTGAATLVVRLHGGSAGRRLTVRINGRPLANPKLESGWQEVTLALPARLLVRGENTLGLATGKKGAVFHSIEISPGATPPPAGAWPPVTPGAKVRVSNQERDALTGFARLLMPVEIPRDAWLTVETATLAGPATVQIAATPAGQPVHLLLDDKQPAGTVRSRRLSLAELGGRLVALELMVRDGSPQDVAWLEPRILLGKSPVRPRPQPAKNLIILVGDALRADKLPMYGETRVRTPAIAQAAATVGVTFTSTQAASPSSPPSHASIQSGCMPRRHGILGDKSKVNPGTPMVSAILAKAGIATEFVGDAGFAMNRLQPVSTWDEFHMPGKEGKGGDCSAVVKTILDFADRHAGQRFFASGVAFEAHTAYIYHPGETEHYYDGPWDDAIGRRPDGVQLTAIVSGKLKMTPERWAQLKGLYDGEVEHLDGCLAALFAGLKTRGLAESTPVVLLADHGEGFLEHGSLGHAYGQYAELTNVPLVFFAPGLGHGQKIATVVSHADVVPTILDLLGLPPDPRVQGESLVPMILRDGAWTPRVEPSEYGRSYSLRARGLHYVVDYGGNEYLFDTTTDPAEKNPLGNQRPLTLRYFRDLAGIYLAHRAAWQAATWGTLNNHRAGFPAP